MIGLLIIGFFATYLVVSLVVVGMSASRAKKRGRNLWLWGGLAAFIMYNLVFWDWIPTVLVHKHYCSTEAGFWVYKTLDQWKQENPGVMETLKANKDAPQTQDRFDDGHGVTDTYLLNERFNWVVIKQDVASLLPIMRFEQQVKDVKKGEVLARYVDFATGNSIKNTVGPPGPLKFWLHNGHCSGGEMNDSKLAHFFIAVKNINDKEVDK